MSNEMAILRAKKTTETSVLGFVPISLSLLLCCKNGQAKNNLWIKEDQKPEFRSFLSPCISIVGACRRSFIDLMLIDNASNGSQGSFCNTVPSFT